MAFIDCNMQVSWISTGALNQSLQCLAVLWSVSSYALLFVSPTQVSGSKQVHQFVKALEAIGTAASL